MALQSLPLQRKLAYAAAAGFVAGALWLIGVRFILVKLPHTHYHANFALYINGQRDQFDNFSFYEEAQTCSADQSDPKTRVHMHDHVNHVVHVHDKGATWGHFFSNLGYGLTDKLVQTKNGIFIDGQDGNRLTFTLNGRQVANVADRTIGNEDRLLINYGKEDDSALSLRFSTVEHDAGEVNKKTDPASCGGTSNEESLWHRFENAIWQSPN